MPTSDGTITTRDICRQAVTEEKLRDSAVASIKLAADLQSDNWNGTTVAAGDATVGWRIERNTGNIGVAAAYVRGPLTAATISADDITAGTLGVDVLYGGRIDATLVNIGDFNNLIPDPDVSLTGAAAGDGGSIDGNFFDVYDSGAGVTYEVDTAISRNGGYSIRAVVTGQTGNSYVSTGIDNTSPEGWPRVRPGDVLYASFFTRAASGTGNNTWVELNWYDADMVWLSAAIGSASSNSTSWGIREVEGTAPANAAFVVVYTGIGNNGLSPDIHFADFYLQKKLAGSLVVDGSITADKITAGTLTSASGVFGAISADDITTGTLDASSVTVINLSASSINTGTLSADYISGGSLSGDLISGGTITGTTVDAGTITTGNLSASRISGGTFDASSMTVTNLSASSINSGSLSASYLSGGTIQAITFQTASSGSRLVIDQTNKERIKFYDGGTLRSYTGVFGGGSGTSGYTIAVDGAQRFWISSTICTFSTYVRTSQNGSKANPGYAFDGSTTTGMYRSGTNIGIVAGGSKEWVVTTSGIYTDAFNTTGTAGQALHFNTGTNEVRRYTSSRRYKKFIQPADTASLITGLRGIEVVTYVPKKGFGEDERTIGIIAEQTAEVLPEAVGLTDGQPDFIIEPMLSFAAVAAIQDLYNRIEKLEALLAA